jgi:hypothetical protein
LNVKQGRTNPPPYNYASLKPYATAGGISMVINEDNIHEVENLINE